MRKLFFYLTITFSCITFGQQIPNYEIGTFIDVNKKVINGYFDSDYAPKTSLNVSYNITENFQKGYYLSNDGLEINGVLKYSQIDRELKYKTNKEAEDKSIKAEQIKGYVIGIDTFSVVKNALIIGVFGDKLSDKSEFAENIETVDGIKFYKFFALEPNGNPYARYLVKKSEASDFESFPYNKSKFIKLASEIFGSDPVLKSNIEKGKYDQKDIPTIIKIFKYRKLYKKGQNIFYNSSGDEISNANESTYYSKIESIQDSIFHISHFLKNNNIKIYEGNFTSFYPHRKQDDFLYYYPNGAVRQKISFKKNKPKQLIEFFENGKTHRVCDILSDGSYIYNEIYDETNYDVNIIDINGNGSELFNDVITGKKITYEYEYKKLKSVYFIELDGSLVYQLSRSNAEIKKTKALQKEISDKLIYPIESLENNHHGYAMVKCIVETSGLVSEVSIVKGISSDCDKAILDFLACLKTEIYWRPGKENDGLVRQEIIIPIDFSIKNTSSYRNNYYNNYYWDFNKNMIQQQMIQQQQWMNQQPAQMIIPAGFR